MTFTDTHCHIHEDSYYDSESAYSRALSAGIKRLIVVGTDETSSRQAVDFAQKYDQAWASIGLHPHDARSGVKAVDDLKELASATKIVAIGEIGLDYFYNNSPKHQQIEMLHAQIELAVDNNLPIIFHVREAFADFWPIFDSYQGLRGVLHSYTDNLSNLDKALSRGLMIGVNGISTFAKDKKDVYQAIPLDHLLLETDAPYLTPVPYRGKINEPAFIEQIAKHLAQIQSIDLAELSRATEQNATKLFSI